MCDLHFCSMSALSRFFAIHVFIMPALMFIFIGIHLMLVLRHGIAEPPTAGKEVDPKTYRREYEELMQKTGHPFWPDGAWRDFVFGTGLIVVIALLAYFIGPPALDKPPDPSILNADPRPDWYLLWYFALLALIPRELEGYLMILGPVVIGILLLAAPMLNNRGERAPSRRPWSICRSPAGPGSGAPHLLRDRAPGRPRAPGCGCAQLPG